MERTGSAVNHGTVLRGLRILLSAAISATKDKPLGLRIVPGYLSRRVVELQDQM
jgi:hypothetical protein